MIIREFNPSQSRVDIEKEIDMEISRMGFPIEEETNLANFIVGTSDEVADDDEDHWSNFRPY